MGCVCVCFLSCLCITPSVFDCLFIPIVTCKRTSVVLICLSIQPINVFLLLKTFLPLSFLQWKFDRASLPSHQLGDLRPFLPIVSRLTFPADGNKNKRAIGKKTQWIINKREKTRKKKR